MWLSAVALKGGKPDWNGLGFKMLRNSYKEENSHDSIVSLLYAILPFFLEDFFCFPDYLIMVI